MLLEIMWGNVWHLMQAGDIDDARQLIYVFRIPRLLNSLCAGIGLALAGLVLQTIFHNPLAGPYVLGISSGAALGVAIALMALGAGYGALSFMGMFLFALVCALLVILILMILARRYSMVSVIIAGILLAGIFSALISVLQYFSPSYAVKNFVVWTMASVDMSNYKIVFFNMIITTLSIAVISKKALVLDGFYLGQDYALSIGIDVKKQRTLLIIVIGVIIAFLTSSYGPIAFVGVISPHIARWISQSQRHNKLIWPSIIIGASVVVWADFISHAFSITVPINSVLSLLGLPVLFLLILKHEYEFF